MRVAAARLSDYLKGATRVVFAMDGRALAAAVAALFGLFARRFACERRLRRGPRGRSETPAHPRFRRPATPIRPRQARPAARGEDDVQTAPHPLPRANRVDPAAAPPGEPAASRPTRLSPPPRRRSRLIPSWRRSG